MRTALLQVLFITTSERLKSFEVDSSRLPSTLDHFSLKSGHVSLPQRLTGLLISKHWASRPNTTNNIKRRRL